MANPFESDETYLYAVTFSGSSLLTNILLELGICVHGSEGDRFWEPTHHGRFRATDYAQYNWAAWHPSLHEQDEFHFREPLRICLRHQLPRREHLSRKSILMTRDYRDTAFSYYKQIGEGRTFQEHLCEPEYLYSQQLIDQFDLCPGDAWALYNRTIAHVCPSVCCVSYEDLKHNPTPSIHRILDHLELDRSTQEVQRAIEASSYANVKAAADRWYHKHPNYAIGSWRAMRSGTVNEWQNTYDPSSLRHLDGLAPHVAQQFGYTPHAIAHASHTPFHQAFALHIGDRMQVLYPECDPQPITALAAYAQEAPIPQIHAAAALARRGHHQRARQLLSSIPTENFGTLYQLAHTCKQGRYWGLYRNAAGQMTLAAKTDLQRELAQLLRGWERDPLRVWRCKISSWMRKLRVDRSSATVQG